MLTLVFSSRYINVDLCQIALYCFFSFLALLPMFVTHKHNWTKSDLTRVEN